MEMSWFYFQLDVSKDLIYPSCLFYLPRTSIFVILEKNPFSFLLEVTKSSDTGFAIFIMFLTLSIVPVITITYFINLVAAIIGLKYSILKLPSHCSCCQYAIIFWNYNLTNHESIINNTNNGDCLQVSTMLFL